MTELRLEDFCQLLNNNASGYRFSFATDDRLTAFTVPDNVSVCHALYSLWQKETNLQVSYEDFQLVLRGTVQGQHIIFSVSPCVIAYGQDGHTPFKVIIKGDVFEPNEVLRPTLMSDRSVVKFFRNAGGVWVAVKILERTSRGDDAIQKELIQNEHLKRLEMGPDCWERIVTMIHHETTPDSQFVVIVMQAFDTDLGSLLDAEFSQQPPPFSTVLWILQELLKATDCFHKQNIILNDIKHLNIVLNRNPPKLAMIDFDGISIAGPDGTSLTTASTTTLGFASWESIVSQRGSFKNDVFAIGMTLFRVITPSNNKDAVDLPFVTREDFEPYTYHERMQTSIVRMRWRMKNYTQEQAEVIVRLFANMVAFAETRWTIPELLEFVQMQLQ